MELGRSKVDTTGRVYFPKKVQEYLKVLPKKNPDSYVTFILENNCVCIYKSGFRVYKNNRYENNSVEGTEKQKTGEERHHEEKG